MNSRKTFGYGTRNLFFAIAVILAIVFTACDDGTGGGNDGGIPSALVGKWYTQADNLAFEITAASLFFFADQLYDVSVSGKTVILKQGGTTVGAFDYAISNNEMTITNGMMVGQTVALLSPVVKGGGSPSGGPPSALVGMWYTQANDVAFEITAAGKILLADQSFDIAVSGKTVTLKQGGTAVGTFDYAISNNTMTITNGTMIGMTVALLSPVVKVSGSNPSGGPPSALVGMWYTQANDQAFEITSAGKILLASQSFDIAVSGNTVTLKQGGAAVGTFDYAISNNTMTITNGTMVGMTIALLSPVVKGGGDPPNPSVVPVTGVSLNSNTLTMAVGQTLTLTANVMPSNATNKAVTWSVSAGTTSITVANGVVYANAAGAATVIVTTVDGGKVASCSVTVLAGGNPITPSTCTVTFDANGGYGSGPNPITATAGSGITLPSEGGLSKAGYAFGGWNTDKDGWGESYYAGAWYTAYGNVTLYAMWMDGAVAIETIEVSFDLNGGYFANQGWIEPIRVEAGSSIILPSGSGIYRDGYTFGGWADSSGTTYAAGSSYTPDTYYYGNYITLYAVWVYMVVVEPTNPDLDSLTVAYASTNTIYPTTPLNALTTNLIVTAQYSDGTSKTLASTDYTLSGALTAGTSTLTVTYEGKTSTFTVMVSDAPQGNITQICLPPESIA